MENWLIEPYRPELAGEWNSFVDNSRNGTFLFRRGYMDYHSDRFADSSWIARKGRKIVALLPANLTPDHVLHSHQGLTYGGWILPPGHIDGSDVLSIFQVAIEVWRDAGITVLDYKPVPSIYPSTPSQEDLYALFRLGAVQTQCGLSATVSLRDPVGFNKLQRRHLAKVLRLGVAVEELHDIDEFMGVLTECLRERHGVRPVHTPGEMKLLAGRFPENIRFFGVRLDGTVAAAVCMYLTPRVAHAQYIATTPRGRELNLLTLLFDTLINRTFSDRDYFDFGISTEDGGRILNEGLLRQKFSYGGTGEIYSRWELTL